MPNRTVTRKAKQDLKDGKSASTAAGEFVHEEIEHVREGKHGARSPQQAIAIGLSEARRAGIPVKAPKGRATAATKKKAAADSKAGENGGAGKAAKKSSKARSKATERALRKEPTSTTSHAALSKHAKKVAAKKAKVSQ